MMACISRSASLKPGIMGRRMTVGVRAASSRPRLSRTSESRPPVKAWKFLVEALEIGKDEAHEGRTRSIALQGACSVVSIATSIDRPRRARTSSSSRGTCAKGSPPEIVTPPSSP